MRKLIAAITIAGLLSSCSSSGSEGTDGTTAPSSDSTPGTGSTTDGSTASGSTAPGDTPGTAPLETQPPLVEAQLPADCPTPTTSTTTPVLPDPVDKPEIELPDPLPTELKITDLTEGTGRAAVAGDVVQVYYVGVRSNDGVEFDSNFGSGTPFPVTLGQGGVIPGWDQGLIGATPGTRRQLDIPPDMAYGDQAQGELIPANTPLTFIVDVVAVDPGPPATDQTKDPSYEFPTVTAGAQYSTQTIVEGDECDFAQVGEAVFVNIKLVRGDNGTVLDNTWANGGALRITLDETTIWGLAQGITGMGLGEQRLITIPPEVGLGAQGNEANQLNADTVLLAYVEFVGRA